MRKILCLLLALTGLALAEPIKIDLSNFPAGWDAPSGHWQRSGAIVAQTGSGERYNLAVHKRQRYRDLTVSVRLRAMRGSEDRGGGLVWRYQDPQSYYICRINPLENNFRLYKVALGRRVQLATVDVALESERWYTVLASMNGDLLQCGLDGKSLLESHDSSFTGSGLVGLWSKADAQTEFADLIVTANDHPDGAMRSGSGYNMMAWLYLNGWPDWPILGREVNGVSY